MKCIICHVSSVQQFNSLPCLFLAAGIVNGPEVLLFCFMLGCNQCKGASLPPTVSVNKHYHCATEKIKQNKIL